MKLSEQVNEASRKALIGQIGPDEWVAVINKIDQLEAEVERLRETQASILERAERVIEGEKWNLAEFVVKKLQE